MNWFTICQAAVSGSSLPTVSTRVLPEKRDQRTHLCHPFFDTAAERYEMRFCIHGCFPFSSFYFFPLLFYLSHEKTANVFHWLFFRFIQFFKRPLLHIAQILFIISWYFREKVFACLPASLPSASRSSFCFFWSESVLSAEKKNYLRTPPYTVSRIWIYRY